jgi:hypothetical protein
MNMICSEFSANLKFPQNLKLQGSSAAENFDKFALADGNPLS